MSSRLDNEMCDSAGMQSCTLSKSLGAFSRVQVARPTRYKGLGSRSWYTPNQIHDEYQQQPHWYAEGYYSRR